GEALHEKVELLERGARLAAQQRARLARARRARERNAPVGAPAAHELDRAVADAARRRLQRAQAGLVVGRVDREAQPGDEVLDLAPLEELRARDDLVRNARQAQRALDRALHEV